MFIYDHLPYVNIISFAFYLLFGYLLEISHVHILMTTIRFSLNFYCMVEITYVNPTFCNTLLDTISCVLTLHCLNSVIYTKIVIDL